MTSRERMAAALSYRQTDRPPHFEVMFELEREAFGLSFPHRDSWSGMSGAEKNRAIGSCVEIYSRIIEEYGWDALMVYWPWSDPEGVKAAVRAFGADIFVGGVCGRGVWSIEEITDWDEFAVNLMDKPEVLHDEAERKCLRAIATIEALADTGADFVYLPNDVCFNAGPFVSPAQFEELVLPYWHRQVARAKELGFYVFIHTDGQIMPILDHLIAIDAHCLQSIDPMAGVDIAEVKRITTGRLALMGNVQCSLLQDGPDEAIRASARYCLENAGPGGGYIYSTSNTIFPGMPLRNYEYMLEVYREFCLVDG